MHTMSSPDTHPQQEAQQVEQQHVLLPQEDAPQEPGAITHLFDHWGIEQFDTKARQLREEAQALIGQIDTVPAKERAALQETVDNKLLGAKEYDTKRVRLDVIVQGFLGQLHEELGLKEPGVAWLEQFGEGRGGEGPAPVEIKEEKVEEKAVKENREASRREEVEGDKRARTMYEEIKKKYLGGETVTSTDLVRITSADPDNPSRGEKNRPNQPDLREKIKTLAVKDGFQIVLKTGHGKPALWTLSPLDIEQQTPDEKTQEEERDSKTPQDFPPDDFWTEVPEGHDVKKNLLS